MTLLRAVAMGTIGFIGYMAFSKTRSRSFDSKETYEEAPIYVSVIGAHYNGRQEQVSKCYPGQTVHLIREHFNPIERNAIAVYAEEEQLGYVKQEVADELAVLMDQGIWLEANVEELTGGEGTPYNLIIKIERSKELLDWN